MLRAIMVPFPQILSDQGRGRRHHPAAAQGEARALGRHEPAAHRAATPHIRSRPRRKGG